MKRVRHINGGKILELPDREAEEMVKSKQFYYVDEKGHRMKEEQPK